MSRPSVTGMQYLIMCMYVLLHVCLSTTCVQYCRDEKTVSDNPEQELQMSVSWCVDAGNQIQVLGRAAHAPGRGTKVHKIKPSHLPNLHLSFTDG